MLPCYLLEHFNDDKMTQTIRWPKKFNFILLNFSEKEMSLKKRMKNRIRCNKSQKQVADSHLRSLWSNGLIHGKVVALSNEFILLVCRNWLKVN